jgi:hypothetical protein
MTQLRRGEAASKTGHPVLWWYQVCGYGSLGDPGFAVISGSWWSMGLWWYAVMVGAWFCTGVNGGRKRRSVHLASVERTLLRVSCRFGWKGSFSDFEFDEDDFSDGFCVQAGEDCGLRCLLRLGFVFGGGDISAVSCQSLEQSCEDGPAEGDGFPGIRRENGFLLKSGIERGGTIGDRAGEIGCGWAGDLIFCR